MWSNLFRYLLELLQIIKFKLGVDRKSFVLKHIQRHHPQSILEIGVFNGGFARRMLKVATKSQFVPIEYVGVDLFAENFSEDIKKVEVSLIPSDRTYIERALEFPNSSVKLYAGYSSTVLPTLVDKYDMILIDGGHSYQTVKEDFLNSINLLAEGGTIFFDDYTNQRGISEGMFGINQVISEINKDEFQISISKNRDWFWKNYGVLELRMVKVSRIKR